jgi:hypothetical protein
MTRTYFSEAGMTGRLYPIGSCRNGWRLLVTRKAHDCAECGQTIQPRRAAWTRLTGITSHDREYIGQKCCQWRIDQ